MLSYKKGGCVMSIELLHCLSESLFEMTELFWQEYGCEIVFPDLKLSFYVSDMEDIEEDKKNYTRIGARAEKPWVTIPLIFYDHINEEMEGVPMENLAERVEQCVDQRIRQYVKEMSLILSNFWYVNKDEIYKDDEDCDLLYDKEALRDYILSIPDYGENEEEEEETEEDECEDDDFSNCCEMTLHRDIIEISTAINCSAKALDEACVEYGFYDEGIITPVAVTLDPQVFIDYRKKCYFANTKDLYALLPKTEIKVDENYNTIE